MTIIGADPGKTGALAMIDGDKLIDAIRIPYAAPIERAWVVGGKHSETRFTVNPIIDKVPFKLPDGQYVAGVYVEEPSMGGGKSKARGSNSGVDASVNRAFQGVLQALYSWYDSWCEIRTVGPKHWQAQLFKVVPRAIESTALVELGIPGGNTPLNTKQRARLACVFQFGIAECEAKLKHTPRSRQLDSGRCDAACLALFGLLHQGISPRLLSKPMAFHMREAGVS